MALTPENGVIDVGGYPSGEATEEVNLNTTADSSTPEDTKAQEELRNEIERLEDEIRTLKQAVMRKEKRLEEVKKELGLTKWGQFKQGIGQKYQSVQNSEMYGKISQGATTTKVAIGDAGGKASAAIKNLGTATAKKWHEIRESQTFQSMEEKLWATTTAVKTKISGAKEAEPLPAGEQTSEQPPPAI